MPQYSGGMQAPFSAMGAIEFGWRGFTKNVVPFLVITAAILILGAAINTLSNLLLTGSLTGTGGEIDPATGLPENFWAAQMGSILASFLTSAITWVLGLALVRGALDVVDTGRTDLSAMFSRIPWGQAILAGLIVVVATFVGTLLCILPGIALAFLLYYTNFAVLDGASATDAVAQSFRFTSGHLGETLLLALLAIVIYVLSLCTLGLALFVAIPVLSMAAAYAWRALQGRQVATV